MDDDGLYETPPAVIGSISAGVGPLPFLGIYAVLFLTHGLLYPVSPPDITSSRAGEAVAGVVAAVLFVLAVLSLWWFLGRRRRWPFVLVQLATLITAIDFIVDKTKGSAAVPVVLALTSLTALVLAFTPASWRHVQSAPPRLPRRSRREPRHARPAQPIQDEAAPAPAPEAAAD